MGKAEARRAKVIALPVPPDGGYGWVIVAASFTLSVILDGICFSIGIFFNEFLDYFEGTKSETAWVGSVMNGMYMVMGPLVSALCNRFGCRVVATGGCIFTCVSFLLATLAPSLPLLTLTFGAMGGMGFGFFYLPAIVMVGFYFEKRRALATGIAVCGSGIGGAIFAPFCSYLIEQFAWKGAILVLAGVTLNGMVMTVLFRPLTAELSDGEAPALAPVTSPGPGPAPRRRADSAVYFCSVAELRGSALGAKDPGSISRSCDHIWMGTGGHGRGKRLDVARPGLRKDAFLSGSLRRIPERQEDAPYICSVTNLRPVAEKAEEAKGKAAEGVRRLLRDLRDGFDLDVLRRVTFLVYGACCMLCMLGFFVPFAYIPRLLVEHGFSTAQAATIISIMSATNVVGRIVVGLVSDHERVDCILINNICLILGGVAVLCIPHFPSMVPIGIAAVFFGVAIAAFVALRSIIMVELLGLEKLSSAFGFVTLCQGFSSFIGTPIAGALSDATGDFHSAFYMAGVTMVLAGSICLPLRRISEWERKRLSRRRASTEMEEEEVHLTSVPNAA